MKLNRLLLQHKKCEGRQNKFSLIYLSQLDRTYRDHCKPLRRGQLSPPSSQLNRSQSPSIELQTCTTAPASTPSKWPSCSERVQYAPESNVYLISWPRRRPSPSHARGCSTPGSVARARAHTPKFSLSVPKFNRPMVYYGAQLPREGTARGDRESVPRSVLFQRAIGGACLGHCLQSSSRAKFGNWNHVSFGI